MVNAEQLSLPLKAFPPSGTSVAIIGAGPAGLIAAETLATAGLAVRVYEKSPAPARKFLMAGRGGLNLTHSEPFDAFLSRYGQAAAFLKPALQAFPPEKLIAWCNGLGIETFVGSSGRVFPKTMKASPLLRAWLARLNQLGVTIKTSCPWVGWDRQTASPLIQDETGAPICVPASATLLAVGGASWPRLSGGGAWSAITDDLALPRIPFAPANCGFIVPWSPIFADKFAGTPLKPVVLSFADRTLQGEIMITAQGLEGGAIYALSAALRDAIARTGFADLIIDLRPGLSLETLSKRLSMPRGAHSLSTHLAKTAGLSREAIGLFQEVKHARGLDPQTPHQIAQTLKALPVRLTATTGLDRAISCAGGLDLNALDARYMCRTLPGLFAAGEMLNWEAPTGGYLLQACFSTGVAAAHGLLDWLRKNA